MLLKIRFNAAAADADAASAASCAVTEALPGVWSAAVAAATWCVAAVAAAT